METSDISREQAAAALATIAESRGLVEAEQVRRRGQRYLFIAFTAMNPLVMYSTKDLVRSRMLRWAVITGWETAVFAVGMELRRGQPRVSRMPMIRKESMQRTGTTVTAVILGRAALELLVVQLLRRSRLRRPNIVAGFVVAGLRAGFHILLDRMTYPRHDRDAPGPSSRLHRPLLLPDTLRIAALLCEGELIDLAYIRGAFGIDRLDLAEDLQPLFDDELAKISVHKDSALVYLTPEGRDAYAQHLRALHDVSTGDTPR